MKLLISLMVLLAGGIAISTTLWDSEPEFEIIHPTERTSKPDIAVRESGAVESPLVRTPNPPRSTPIESLPGRAFLFDSSTSAPDGLLPPWMIQRKSPGRVGQGTVHEIEILVVDTDGIPQPNFPLQTKLATSEHKLPEVDRLGTQTDAEGIAKVHPISFGFSRAKKFDGTILIAARLPVLDSVQEEVFAASSDGPPIVFMVPPAGSLIVQLIYDHPPRYSDPPRVFISFPTGPNKQRKWQSIRPQSEDQYRKLQFPFIPTGTPFSIRVESADDAHLGELECIPLGDDESARVAKLTMKWQEIELVGRLQLPDGKPYSKGPFHFKANSNKPRTISNITGVGDHYQTGLHDRSSFLVNSSHPRGLAWVAYRTDSAGRFALLVNPSKVKTGSLAISRPNQNLEATAEIAWHGAKAGQTHSLGWVKMILDPFLTTGTVIDPAGKSVGYCRIDVEELDPAGKTLRHARFRTDGLGHFRWEGKPQGTHVRFRLPRPHSMASGTLTLPTPLTLPIAQPGVQVKLTSAAQIKGEIRLAGDERWEVCLVQFDGATHRTPVRPDGSFWYENLSPGSVDLFVVRPGKRAPYASILNLPLWPGIQGDPRLKGIVLSETPGTEF